MKIMKIKMPGRPEIILIVPWEKHYLGESKGVSNEKAYITRKMS